MNYRHLGQCAPIPQAEQFTYNKAFDPNNPENVQAWYNLPVPSNMKPFLWQIAVWELTVLCPQDIDSKKQQKILLNWLLRHGLLTPA